MFTQIYKKAAILSLLFVLANILACGICMVSAEESPYLDLEVGSLFLRARNMGGFGQIL